MFTRRYLSWSRFKEDMLRLHSRLPAAEREQFWFRGHGDSAWQLRTTLDRWAERYRPFQSDEDRDAVAEVLLDAFREESVGLRRTIRLPRRHPAALELLARHHGLPTPILDWTLSPYVAAFFAFERWREGKTKLVAIYALRRQELGDRAEVQLISDKDLLRHNRRALEQAAVFMRVNIAKQPTEELLGDALTKFEISKSQASLALADLASMGITARSLFRDLDAAARTAVARLEG